MMRRGISAFIISMMMLVPGCLSSGPDDVFYGEDISPPIPVDEFILIDEEGEYVAMSEFSGKVVVVAFLFTRCPDISPVVSANLAFNAEELSEQQNYSIIFQTSFSTMAPSHRSPRQRPAIYKKISLIF